MYFTAVKNLSLCLRLFLLFLGSILEGFTMLVVGICSYIVEQDSFVCFYLILPLRSLIDDLS